MANIKVMKFKINLVFLTSIIIGFWYVSGRSYLDGVMHSTGFSTAHLGVEVSDYAYYGFLYSYHQILWLGLVISTLLLFFKIIKTKNSILKGIYYFLAYLKHKFFEKGMLFNEIKVRNQISSKILEGSLKAKELNFPLILNLWSAFNLIFPVILLAIIYNWINFYNEGEEEGEKTILTGISYIESDNDKYFELICGKGNCIYQTKDFSKSISKKEYTIKIKNLKSITTYNFIEIDKSFSAFEVDKHTNKENIIYLYQVNMTKELTQNDLKSHISLCTKENKIYQPIVIEKTVSLNLLANRPELPIFLTFELPKNEKVEFIFAHKPPYQLNCPIKPQQI
ncbi:hypothetical protein [Acinetobacter sp. V115_6]|uniref:hypothetical protein n=1 Tax=Acinetobacter sp. V115_6 TaxID=3072987 RepID=UPI00287C25E4|nr:hypothetical protein [Acinetobacter sp. V115_6]MDS7926162.1 hypothetical protein [Acinetobacter sp. V115_6]